MKLEIEFFVVIACGFLGYAIVAKLIDYLRDKSINEKSAQEHEKSRDADDFANDNMGMDIEEDMSWWDTLGISRDASLSAVQQAYRSLKRKYDPESTKSLGAEFQVIAEEFTRKIDIAYAEALKEKERHGLSKK